MGYKRRSFILINEYISFYVLTLLIMSLLTCLFVIKISLGQKDLLLKGKLEFEKIVLYYRNSELKNIIGDYDYIKGNENYTINLDNISKKMI